MSSHLVTTQTKPVQNFSLHDWRANVIRLRDVANARRADAFIVRNASRLLRNESHIESEWANYETNIALDHRIGELNMWRDVIAKSFNRLLKEYDALDQERKAAENVLQWHAGPVELFANIQATRDSRTGSDLTVDQANTELKNEFYILENNQKLLAKQIQKAGEKLARLAEVRTKVLWELENKTETVNIDTVQRSLERDSTVISFKPDPLRPLEGSRTYMKWLEYTENLKQMIDNETEETIAIRESLFVCSSKAMNMVESQSQMTELALRNRIFQTEQAFNELDWQRHRLLEDMHAATCEIEALERSLEENRTLLKLAESRLENRTKRCPTELVLDDVYDSLYLEVEKLREIRTHLQNKIEELRANFNLLSEHETKIEHDIVKKEHALETDKKALQLRKSFRDAEKGVVTCNPCPQTERNIEWFRAKDIIEPK